MKNKELIAHLRSVDMFPCGSFLTGSRVMGHWTVKSDWDVVIPSFAAEDIKSKIETEPSEYNSGFTAEFDSGRVTVNFIPLYATEMLAWWNATQAFELVADNLDHIHGNLRERQLRHAAFETLRGTYKGLFSSIRPRAAIELVVRSQSTHPLYSYST